MSPAPLIASVVGAAVVFAWRLREAATPVTAVKLLAPPLGMSTGFAMFLAPPTRIPWSWGVVSWLTGALLFSYPLIATSRLVRQGDAILLRRSRAFLWILIGLVVVRFALRGWVEQHVSTMQTGSIFFVLAFGMLLPWRVAMFLQYRALKRQVVTTSADH
jgi:membrane protein CcdC involved in cytochrome C biogenesis